MQNASKTPIIDLLRRIPRETWVEIIEPSGWSYHTNIGNLLHEAADEIDRLQNHAQQSVQLTVLRRWLVVSWSIVIVLLAVVAFIIGGN